MRRLTLLLLLFSLAVAEAHEVSGAVQVLLKGDKNKTDLSSVIVYLDQKEGDAKITPSFLKKDYTMTTKNKQFLPRSLAVPVGGTVNFPNYDPIFHNLFSISAPNNFDLGLYKGGASKTKVFEAPGIVKVFCNVHPQMVATIVICNTPYFTVADQSGNYSLGIIPWGIYDVRAYSEEGQALQTIEVKDVPLKINLTIDGRNFKKLSHKNKFGKDYSTDQNEGY